MMPQTITALMLQATMPMMITAMMGMKMRQLTTAPTTKTAAVTTIAEAMTAEAMIPVMTAAAAITMTDPS
jgi:hypothetical protein